ncbi:MAG: dynamin family protein [Pleurocapsa sp. MO_226.B13]|nr:dynamin family protein [Pleurocapsa sp. MO_226.B13]
MSSFELFQETRDGLYEVLNQLAGIAEERQEKILSFVKVDTGSLNANQELNRQSLADILRERAENVRKKHAFRLAVVGEFNAGKSTIINALLGKEILSVSCQPTTAAVTTLRFNEKEQFKVTYQPEYQAQHPTITQESTDLFQDIAKYTSDPAQSKDLGVSILKGEEVSLAEKIKEVEVWCNADFLRDRQIEIEIIDTPGLGSVFAAHKTVTYSLIPQVDATLFLFSHDGIGEGDLAFLTFLREHVNQMLFVMTKIDQVRDQKELEDSLDFNQNIITTKVDKINIQNIYPVSAVNALDGLYEESGFLEFKQALERFLIKSSGVARLQIPLQVADLHLKTLQRDVDRDIEVANKSLKKVQEDKETLEQQKQHINQRKQDLMRDIHDTIKDMLDDAMHGIDLLDTQIQMAVERQVDVYGVKDFFKVDKHIPCIFKEEIDKWITKKEERFQNKAELLYGRIEENLRVMLGILESIGSSTSQNKGTDVVTPQIKGVFTKGILQVTQSAAVNTATSASTGLTLSSLLFAIGVSPILDSLITQQMVMGAGAVAVPILVLIPLLLTMRTIIQQAFGFKKKLVVNIKKAMTENMPNNSINIYKAVVEGYIDNKGIPQPGLREIVVNSFNAWSNQLKENVELVVTNNVDSHNESLEKRIRKEERGEWNPENNIKTYNQQKEVLLKTEKRLIELKTIIQKLSEDGAIKNVETE